VWGSHLATPAQMAGGEGPLVARSAASGCSPPGTALFLHTWQRQWRQRRAGRLGGRQSRRVGVLQRAADLLVRALLAVDAHGRFC
jgi:hypothetical protein